MNLAAEEATEVGHSTCDKLGRLGVIGLVYGTAGRRLSLTQRIEAAKAIDALAADSDVYAAVVETSGAPFCLGEDRDDVHALTPEALAAAYRAVWRFDRFPKPLVTLLEGEAEWAGLSLVLNGTHKVADPGATFTVLPGPAGAGLGWGANMHLGLLPRCLGYFLTLTGQPLDASLAYRLGWLTHIVPAAEFAGIKQRLGDGDPVDALLDGLDQGGGLSALDAHLPAIERCFSAASPEAILARLEAIQGTDADWAAATAAHLRAANPADFAATCALLAGEPPTDLRTALTADFARVTLTLTGQSPLRPLDLQEPRPPSIS